MIQGTAKTDPARIMVIDDETVICEACTQILSQEGYQVETANNGSTGLEKARTSKPDVIFVDLKMPGMGGLEVLDRIREIDRNIVAVVITGYATIESAVDSMKHGALEFLPKPFTPEELSIITRRAVEKHRITVEAERLKNEKEHMRQNFISLVSHELRTPLVAVIQYLEVLSGGILGAMPPEQEKVITRMKIRLNELLLLVNRWLKFARIEEMDIRDNFTKFNIRAVIGESLELVKPLAAEKKIELVDSTGADANTVSGDREMIKEVITNIMSNGIKYNREGGRLTVETRQTVDTVIIDITDTGIGIPIEELARVGDEFYRTKREGLAAGSGLGLAIVKKILDIHGGRLEIKSRLDLGSTFSIVLLKTPGNNKTVSERSAS
jgi:two-component system sensor histidine kinase/response regulator